MHPRELLKSRLVMCNQCEDFNGNVCEIRFARGGCRKTWETFLADGFQSCPRGNFPATKRRKPRPQITAATN